MPIYEYYVNDASDISTKISIINNRIIIDPEITTSLSSIVYSDPNIVVTFATPLLDNETKVLDTIFRTVMDGTIPGIDFDYNNIISNSRNVINSSVDATNEYDIYSGYNVGSTIYDPLNRTYQVCFDSSVNSAIWGKFGGLTGATGYTGATGAIGPTGATGSGLLMDMQLVSSTSNISTTSTSYSDISGASITTKTLGFVGNTGTYMISFMATVNAGLLASGAAIQLNVDNTDIISTEITSTGTSICGISTAHKVDLLNDKVIKAQWKSLGGTANLNSYTMHIIGVPSSSIV